MQLWFLIASCLLAPSAAGLSLTLVIDTSGSMLTEVRLLRLGLLSLPPRRLAAIEEYILVPFSDPEVGTVVRTRDVEVLHRQLASLRPRSGGDCPEMALSGLLKATEMSRSSSIVLFFSNASAKDFEFAEQLIARARRKRLRLVMMLTGTCIGDRPEGRGVFDTVARATGGVVYRASRTGVSALMAFLKVSMTGNVQYLQNPPATFRHVAQIARKSSIDMNDGVRSAANIQVCGSSLVIYLAVMTFLGVSGMREDV